MISVSILYSTNVQMFNWLYQRSAEQQEKVGRYVGLVRAHDRMNYFVIQKLNKYVNIQA